MIEERHCFQGVASTGYEHQHVVAVAEDFTFVSLTAIRPVETTDCEGNAGDVQVDLVSASKSFSLRRLRCFSCHS